MRFPLKYSADSGETRTIGDIADEIAFRLAVGDDAADVIDEEFLWGAWGHICEGIENQKYTPDGPLFLKNVRGMMKALYEAGVRDGKT